MRLIHHFGAAGGGGQRQAGGDRLGADQDVGRDAELLHGE